MATSAIVLVFYEKHYIVAMIGILTAAGSFTAQYVTYFCPYCTAAAFSFLIGGLINLRGRYQQVLPVSIISTVCITVSLTLFIFSPVPYYGFDSMENEIIVSDKPLLYISTECRACEETVKFFIAHDTKGDEWQPVILGDSEKEKNILTKGIFREMLVCLKTREE